MASTNKYAVTVLTKPTLWTYAHRAHAFLVAAASLFVVLLVAGDAIVNNWALVNFMGGGYFFVTPIAAATSLDSLGAQYSFAANMGLQDLSKSGRWMSNYTVTHMVAKSEKIYVIATGDIPLTPHSVLCPIFEARYAVDLNATNGRVHLALASDAVSFFRGNAISHAFTDDDSANLANASMGAQELFALNYVPGRVTVDKRFTNEIQLRNTTAPQTHVVSYYRIFSRSLCTGCDPVAELGYGSCNFTVVYNDSAKAVTVTNSTYVPGSVYKLGIVMPHTFLGELALVAKSIAIAFAVLGYLASRRTVQWPDATHVESSLAKALRTILPKCFPYPSHALSYSMFCYNSDWFVILYAFSVLIDIRNCLMYVRNVNLYTMYAPQFGYSLQLFALTSRLLWVNCAILKCTKGLVHMLSVAQYAGESRLVGFFNLSSVSWLYASAIALFYVPPLIEYNNSVVINLTNARERIDGICVGVYDGFYMRVATSIAVGLVANIFLVTGLNHVCSYKYWQLVAKNSLARQAVFNSSSIVCDYLDGLQADGDGSIFVLHARRVSTLQWFFSSHLTLFGLPEKGLRAKKLQVATQQSQKAPSARSASAAIACSTTASNANAEDDARDCSVVQSGDAALHLLDGRLVEVSNLAFNIKLLKNLTVTVK
ncbi:hypothetical protein SPRG_05415 [Saprolegnia parasitica CBS 223.65]|uniref:Uncharacterized protein n=1 Tax=Saprolegnia parasitica (strain CBS 223.65) TaxID=695850 RepID=A0A067CFD6_SAPPC|nr:hypothetical protein SPRG_05415 [Saprolegnia parasitica CBS 223.65]KDO29173.1 hypothetical protein SPRG_05415 [Saprolegnia parasitica CBS 223.65]|eukprot:XP_012200050.1 hypothetical protein SPRG_05415 [Saprolegnia parasitica CBS 223.65]